MILSDYHMHSAYSSDSDTPMQNMIEQAIQLHLKEICFTDHMDFDYPKVCLEKDTNGNDYYLDFLFDVTQYIKQIASFREQYQSKINIATGIELGLQSHIVPQVKELMENNSFDFVIGSSHLLYGDDPYYEHFWNQLKRDNEFSSEEKLVQHAIRDYFTEIHQNVQRFPWFQVYGHLDYIVRYAPQKGHYYHPFDYMDIIEEILKDLIQSGRGIELNTSGLKSGLAFANPHMDILKRYKELGGEIITVGADAHTTEYIGYKFNKASEMLLSAGFSYYTTFHHQLPSFHKLI